MGFAKCSSKGQLTMEFMISIIIVLAIFVFGLSIMNDRLVQNEVSEYTRGAELTAYRFARNIDSVFLMDDNSCLTDTIYWNVPAGKSVVFNDNHVSVYFPGGFTGANISTKNVSWHAQDINGLISFCKSNGFVDVNNVVSAVVSFSPETISNLSLWVSADRIVGLNDNDSISTWSDLSGNNNDFTQGEPSQQPVYKTNILNGLPVVRLSAGSSQTMSSGTNYPAPVSVFYVGRVFGTNDQRLLTSLNNNWLLGFWGSGMDQAHFDGWVVGEGSPTADTEWHIYDTVVRGEGLDSSFYGNGTLLASNSGGTAGPNGLCLSGYQCSSEFSDGDIAEIIVYGRVLSDEERQQVEDYLSSKYGIALSR